MQQSTYRQTAVIFIGVMICLPGCQAAGLPGFPGSARKAAEENDRPLSGQQVAEVQLSLAHSLELQGELDPALEAYRQAVETDPRRSTGYWRMAIINDRKGNPGESESLYRKALKLDPKNADLHCDYGYSLYLQRRWGEAETSLQKAIELKPKHLRAHNNLGLVLAQAEQPVEALAEFRNAGCDTADRYNNLAFVMMLNRRWDKAREFYELALDADGDSATAKTGLKDLDSIIAKVGRSQDGKQVSLTTLDELALAGAAREP